MTSTIRGVATLVLASALGFATAHAQQVPLPRTAAEVPTPPPGTAMGKAYVQTVGRMAYTWGYAMVNSHNRRAGFAYVTGQNGNVAGLNGGVVPMAPVNEAAMLTDYVDPSQTFVTCPNQDVVYGAGYYALDKEPVVFQVPDFGDRFWVYALYDARTDQFAEIGKPYVLNFQVRSWSERFWRSWASSPMRTGIAGYLRFHGCCEC